MHRLLTKTSGSVLVAVIGGDSSNSSRLNSKDPPSKMEQRAAERVQSHSSYLPASLRMPPPPPLGGSGKETMVLCEEETRAPQTV